MLDERNEEFDLATLFGKTVLFSYERVDPTTIPEGMYCYDIRHSDDDFSPAKLEKQVFVNYYGTVISNMPIDVPIGDTGFLNISEDDIHFDDFATATMEAYLKGDYELTPEPEKEIRILVVEPFKLPYELTVPNTLEAQQKLVGGHIEAIYPFDNKTVLICNEEGKLLGLQLNRKIGNDIVAGTFFICGANNRNGSFSSLTEEQMNRFKKEFEVIELYGPKRNTPKTKYDPQR